VSKSLCLITQITEEEGEGLAGVGKYNDRACHFGGAGNGDNQKGGGGIETPY